MKIIFYILIIFIVTLAIGGCFGSSSTSNIKSISDFDVQRYLGKWYEIARLPNSFENGLIKVTATYSLKKDGEIEVLNQGVKETGENSKAIGRAWIPDKTKPSSLQVSFFWIFAADYKIIELEKEKYSYALVTSGTKDYLWILSRTPQMNEDAYNQLVKKASDYGFDTSKLYRVPQE